MDIGIMGGTFDPIHMGHLIMAQQVKQQFQLDKILFIPTGSPSHKRHVEVTDSMHRYTMTKLAICDNDDFEITDYEIKKEGITYTFDTITHLRQVYNANLYFIIGDDSLLSLLQWYKATELLKLCKFVVVSRPSYDNEEVIKQIQFLTNNHKAEILHLEFLDIGISSTQIREKVYNSQSIKYLVPDVVQNYINRHKIYHNKLTLSQEFVDSSMDYIKNKLTNKRYSHTIGVVKMGLKLAQIHGVDMNKTYIGALFHDVAKHMTTEEGAGYEVEFDEFELKYPHTAP